MIRTHVQNFQDIVEGLDPKFKINPVIYKIMDDMGKIIYIGRSWDPLSRISEHIVQQDSLGIYYLRSINKHKWTVQFIFLPKVKEGTENYWIKEKEAKLIRLSKPKLNYCCNCK